LTRADFVTVFDGSFAAEAALGNRHADAIRIAPTVFKLRVKYISKLLMEKAFLIQRATPALRNLLRRGRHVVTTIAIAGRCLRRGIVDERARTAIRTPEETDGRLRIVRFARINEGSA
jgi:hypothetical protein